MNTKHLIKKAGGLTKIAEMCSITKQAVSQWKIIPHSHVLTIEKATNGAVKRYELRPDIYPPEEYQQNQQQCVECN